MTYNTALLPDRLAELDSIRLLRGTHKHDHEFCYMELVAYLAGEPHTDRPQCVSRVIGAFVRPVNDWLNDEERQLLKPYVVRAFGTVGTPEQENERAFMLADWAIHVVAPLALRASDLEEQAAKLEALPVLDSRTVATCADAAAGAVYAAATAATCADAAAHSTYAAAGATYAAATAVTDAAYATAVTDAAYATAQSTYAAATYAAATYATRQKIIEGAVVLLGRLIAVTEGKSND